MQFISWLWLSVAVYIRMLFVVFWPLNFFFILFTSTNQKLCPLKKKNKNKNSSLAHIYHNLDFFFCFQQRKQKTMKSQYEWKKNKRIFCYIILEKSFYVNIVKQWKSVCSLSVCVCVYVCNVSIFFRFVPKMILFMQSIIFFSWFSLFISYCWLCVCVAFFSSWPHHLFMMMMIIILIYPVIIKKK